MADVKRNQGEFGKARCNRCKKVMPVVKRKDGSAMKRCEACNAEMRADKDSTDENSTAVLKQAKRDDDYVSLDADAAKVKVDADATAAAQAANRLAIVTTAEEPAFSIAEEDDPLSGTNNILSEDEMRDLILQITADDNESTDPGNPSVTQKASIFPTRKEQISTEISTGKDTILAGRFSATRGTINEGVELVVQVAVGAEKGKFKHGNNGEYVEEVEDAVAPDENDMKCNRCSKVMPVVKKKDGSVMKRCAMCNEEVRSGKTSTDIGLNDVKVWTKKKPKPLKKKSKPHMQNPLQKLIFAIAIVLGLLLLGGTTPNRTCAWLCCCS